MLPDVKTGAAAAERQAQTPARTQINVVLFSGGSGTHSITQALLLHPQISLKILINAYDDGHSTGRLRAFIPGMLGPSDVRKNIARLMPAAERSQRALKKLSDLRLPVGVSRSEALATIDQILGGSCEELTMWQHRRLCSYLNTFLAYYRQQEREGRFFDFTDCAIAYLNRSLSTGNCEAEMCQCVMTSVLENRKAVPTELQPDRLRSM